MFKFGLFSVNFDAVKFERQNRTLKTRIFTARFTRL